MVVGRVENPDPCGVPWNGLGPGGFFEFWFTVLKANAVSCWTRGRQRFALRSRDGLDVAVFLDQNMAILKLLHHSQSFAHHVTSPAKPSCLFALFMVLTMNARRFQRTHLLSEMGSAVHA